MSIKREKIIADWTLCYSEQPVRDDVVFFFENHAKGPKGIVSSIFFKMLEDPANISKIFVWVVRDYDESLESLGGYLNDPRIWIVYANGHDYCKYISIAKEIYIDVSLPNNYAVF